jgi:hypothetical protein
VTLKIANGAGFLGDDIDAPRRLVEAAEVDYLTLEYLAELTMSILARSREKNADAGFAKDFLDVVQSLTAALRQQQTLRVVTNAGGVNPLACARRVSQILAQAGLPETKVGVVAGDDLLPRLDELRSAGCDFRHADNGAPLSELTGRIVSANAYLGAAAICQALTEEARIVITGRVADASLTVGPAIHEFGWDWTDWDRLAAGSVAGHLIECGAQVTGGYSTRWKEHALTSMGYPIAELEDDGTTVITKPAGSGGCVNRRTVTEQLVYEIGDPQNYITPDVVVDFTSLQVRKLGENRVEVRAATGKPAPDRYKVSLAYQAGYFSSCELLVFGSDCIDKARCCAQLVFDRLRNIGIELAQTNVELLGTGDAYPIEQRVRIAPPEVVLRLTVADPRRDAVERFTKEIAPLITNGPAGLAGYASGRSSVRPVFAYWPTLAPKDLVEPQVEVRSAKEWLEEPSC